MTLHGRRLDEVNALALARTTPLTRSAVAELAKRMDAESARKAALLALDAAGVSAALVLAFVAISKGVKLPPELTLALLPEVLSLDHVGPLVFATEGRPIDVLVAFLGQARGDLELESFALLLAAEEHERTNPIPGVLLTRGRWLARHRLEQEASLFLGGSALRLGDADFSALAAPHVNRARRAKRALEEALEAAGRAPLDALEDVEGTRVSTGFTVRHDSPPVGRNDPCPCGSGKKYKKCHALEESHSPALPETPKLDPTTLGPEQASLLRPSEIATLDTSRLSSKSFVEAFRRVVDFRQWDLALRMIGEAETRDDFDESAISAFVVDALHGAYDARANEAAERFHSMLPESAARIESFAIECLRAPSDMLEKIEREAGEALQGDADGTRGLLFASALLRWFPALGIYVARGALHEGHPHGSRALLEAVEDARDRLLLSPFEAWWDVYDALVDGETSRSLPSSTKRLEQKKNDAKREKMKADLRRARAMSRKLAAEMEKLQTRVAELDESIANTRQPTHKSKVDAQKAAPSPELAEERRRLKSKIDELQRIIGEGQEERRELRRMLAEREERGEDDDVPSTFDRSRREVTDEDAGSPNDTISVDIPRNVLVPRFSDRAAKALTDLALDTAELVLGVVAALASGKPNVWGGVKQLAKVRGVFSARAGIHHRILFTFKDHSLEVIEVLHRRDLEHVVARLSRV